MKLRDYLEANDILLNEETLNEEVTYDIPENAPEEVKELIRIFNETPEEERDTDILLYHVLGHGTPPYKMSKEASSYADVANDPAQSCATCEYLYLKVNTGQYACSQIRGEVKASGWCNQFKTSQEYE